VPAAPARWSPGGSPPRRAIVPDIMANASPTAPLLRTVHFLRFYTAPSRIMVLVGIHVKFQVNLEDLLDRKKAEQGRHPTNPRGVCPPIVNGSQSSFPLAQVRIASVDCKRIGRTALVGSPFNTNRPDWNFLVSTKAIMISRQHILNCCTRGYIVSVSYIFFGSSPNLAIRYVRR